MYGTYQARWEGWKMGICGVGVREGQATSRADIGWRQKGAQL